MAKCEISGCSQPEDRIADGHRLCARHQPGDLKPQLAVDRCEVCGEATARQGPGDRRCSGHAKWDAPAGWRPAA
jgi:hypothetical protein